MRGEGGSKLEFPAIIKTDRARKITTLRGIKSFVYKWIKLFGVTADLENKWINLLY